MTYLCLFWITFLVLVCSELSLVQTVDECKTSDDCKAKYGSTGNNYCCYARWSWGKEKRCRPSLYCLDNYCSNDADCGTSSLCCRSNTCVNKGCSGCRNNADCYSGHACCKKTFPVNQTVCSENCINEICNWNDDCAGYGECCRAGKCVDTGCYGDCTSHSECNLGEYCCKKIWDGYYNEENRCVRNSCSGYFCNTKKDCGGPNECCISNECVIAGCSGCTSNIDCSVGQYCCKKREWYELNECSADCIGKSCSTSNDCGGPDETCNSHNRCALEKECSNCLRPWLVSVIVLVIAALLIAIGVFVARFCYLKGKRTANVTHVNRETTDIQNIQVAENQNAQPDSNSTQNQGLQNPPQHSNLPDETDNPTYQPPRFQFGAQEPQNPLQLIPPSENPGLYPPTYSMAMSSNPNQHGTEAHHLHNPLYHTLESPTQNIQQGSSAPQF